MTIDIKAIRAAAKEDQKRDNTILLRPTTVLAMCDEIERLKDLLGKANALCRIRADEIERLQQEVSTLQRIVAESYQVMGILADEAGRFDDPHVVKALDNAGLIELQHEDVLPFPCKTEMEAKT